MQNQHTLNLEIPSDILIALNETEAEFIRDVKFFTAVRFYQLKKLSLGKAAQLAGLSRFEFESKLSRLEIPVSNLEMHDIEKDIENLKAV